MAKIFKPRRGKKSTMAGTKKTTVLSAGEMFIEVPDTGAGTGHSKMKIGDGSTQYSSLPYAMGDTENDKIAFSNDTSGNITTALNKVTSGAALKTMIAALKQAVSLANTSITQLNDECDSIRSSFQDGVDTLYNKCVSCGWTPTGKTPTHIAEAIQGIYGNRYTEGYNNGRTQGQNDVKNNPNGYGLYNKTQYDQNYNNGYNSGYNVGYEQGLSEGVGSNVVLIGGGYGNRSGFNFSKSGLSFKKCLLVYSFSAYYMRPESDGWGIISATGITLSLLSKQWFNTYRNTGLGMFIYNGTDVQDTITVTAKAEEDGTTSTMVVYCIY